MPRGHHNGRLRGPAHPNFNHGEMRSTRGYIKCRVGVGHPAADINGYAYKHVLVWVESGNPRPGKGFVLHHINEDKTDNRIENLEMLSAQDHARKHHPMLSDEDVRAIREKYASGVANMASLAREYKVRSSRVREFIIGESRLSAGGPVLKSNRINKGAQS